MKIAVVGSFVVDLMARTPHLPEPGETVMGSFFKAGPGGKGANQAVAAKKAGGDVVFSTKLGRDDFARIALDSFQEAGLPLDYVIQTGEAPTGAALISVDEGTAQNEIVVVLGACNTYNQADLEQLEGALEGCGYLLLQMEINPDALVKLVEMANRKGIRVILNPAPVQPLADEVYHSLYMVTPNEVEARILTGIPCDDEEGCSQAAAAFFAKGVEKVIITLGKRGVYLHDGEKERFFENYPVQVLDTTGAGDAFNGGLLAGLGMGMTLEQAASYGNVVANLAVTKLGTAPAMPSRKEIEAFMAERKIRL